jgi:diguanylate cyclase (GGDEF)-like protein/PAS domain S-box-containing protein
MDFKTLAIALSISNLLQIVALFTQWKMSNKYNGVGWWALGITANAMGFLAMFLRALPGLTPIGIFANNVFFVLGHILLYIGVLRFFERKAHHAALVSLLGVYVLVDFYFVFIYDHLIWRGSILYLTIAGMAFLTAWTLWRYKFPPASTSVHFLAGTYLLHGSMFVIGFIMGLVLPPSSNNSTSNANLGQLVGLLDGLAVSMLWTLGFILMVNQRLNAENREARQELELIFNASPEALLVTRLNDGLVLEGNAGFSAMYGYPREEVVGSSTLDLSLWKDPTDRQTVVDMLREDGVCSNREFEFIRKDGSQLTGLFSARRLQLRGAAHVLNTIHDVTVRKQLEQKLQEQATTDGLTGIFNRRHFLELADYEVQRAIRLDQPLSIVLLDIDYFKQINDSYGHQAGDAVLVNFARICRENIRNIDLLARIGGDEFAILLPAASSSQSSEMMSRVHAALATAQTTHPATTSGGIACLPCEIDTLDGLIDQADQALYRAKHAGRNRTEVYK